MNIFFKKKLTESDLRELLLSGNESKWNQLRKYFIQQLRLQDLKFSPKKYFFNNLKAPHESKTSFEKAFQNLIKNPPLPDQSILNSFERHLDFELIQLMQANDLTLLNQAENYLFFRFYLSLVVFPHHLFPFSIILIEQLQLLWVGTFRLLQ